MQETRRFWWADYYERMRISNRARNMLFRRLLSHAWKPLLAPSPLAYGTMYRRALPRNPNENHCEGPRIVWIVRSNFAVASAAIIADVVVAAAAAAAAVIAAVSVVILLLLFAFCLYTHRRSQTFLLQQINVVPGKTATSVQIGDGRPLWCACSPSKLPSPAAVFPVSCNCFFTIVYGFDLLAQQYSYSNSSLSVHYLLLLCECPKNLPSPGVFPVFFWWSFWPFWIQYSYL